MNAANRRGPLRRRDRRKPSVRPSHPLPSHKLTTPKQPDRMRRRRSSQQNRRSPNRTYNSHRGANIPAQPDSYNTQNSPRRDRPEAPHGHPSVRRTSSGHSYCFKSPPTTTRAHGRGRMRSRAPTGQTCPPLRAARDLKPPSIMLTSHSFTPRSPRRMDPYRSLGRTPPRRHYPCDPHHDIALQGDVPGRCGEDARVTRSEGHV